MVLHVHKDLTDKLSLTDIGNKFVGQSEYRLALFGSFSERGYEHYVSVIYIFGSVFERDIWLNTACVEFNIRF